MDGLLLEYALREAYEFAALAHAGQARKGSHAPYITHPLAVMGVLVDLGVRDATILRAALLHDVVENSHRTMREVRETFGQAVASLLADLIRPPSARRDRAALCHHLRALGHGARLITLADRIHNLKGLRTIVDDPLFVYTYLDETRDAYLAESWADETNPTLAEMLRAAVLDAERHAFADGVGFLRPVSGNGAHDRGVPERRDAPGAA